MKRFVIEREIPGVGLLGPQELQAAAKQSCDALRKLGSDIQWVNSFVAGDKTFCIYLAKDEEIVRKHADISKFPATKITEVPKTIDPTTER